MVMLKSLLVAGGVANALSTMMTQEPNILETVGNDLSENSLATGAQSIFESAEEACMACMNGASAMLLKGNKCMVRSHDAPADREHQGVLNGGSLTQDFADSTQWSATLHAPVTLAVLGQFFQAACENLQALKKFELKCGFETFRNKCPETKFYKANVAGDHNFAKCKKMVDSSATQNVAHMDENGQCFTGKVADPAAECKGELMKYGVRKVDTNCQDTR